MVFSVGPVTVPAEPVVFVGATFVAYWIVRLLIPRANRPVLALVADRIVGAVVIAILVWKLTPFVTYFDAVMKDPVILLRLPGGDVGIIAGVAAAGIYLFLTATIKQVTRIHYKLFFSFLAAALVLGSLSITLLRLAEGRPGTDRILSTLSADNSSTESASSKPPSASEPRRSRVPRNLPLQLLDGEQVNVTAGSFRGKPTLLTFWATWCGPCKAELPVKKRLYDTYGSQVNIVAINIIASEPSVSSVKEYVLDNDIPFTIGLDHRNRWSSAFLVRGTPTTVLLDSTGVVRDRWFGPVSYDRAARAIERLGYAR